MDRRAARANAIAALALRVARLLGFGPAFEGKGLIP
jgi:hypothetical protein